jgi:hypothetical protein
MRRLSLSLAGGVSLAVFALWPTASGTPSLPLHAPAAVTAQLLAVASTAHGSRLEQFNPSTFTAVKGSAAVGWYDGWVASPDHQLLAVATHSDASNSDSSTIRFANPSTLRWVRRGIALDGYFLGGLWPRMNTLYALTGNCCTPGSTLETISTVSKRVLARTPISGLIPTVARSADSLVFLTEAGNKVAPVTLGVIDPNGAIRSVPLTRILGGTHFDLTAQEPIGTTRQPGLAVDPIGNVAYVIDDGGLVAQVALGNLSVSYHQLNNSLLDRLSAWLTPSAQAKGINGPTLSARWLGDGLIAVNGTHESAIRHKDGSISFASSPAGLRIIDTSNWSEHTLDPNSTSAIVTDGLLLASGGSWTSDGNTTTSTGEGIAAYGPDGALRWRIDAGQTISVLAAYGSRALIQKNQTGSTYVQEPIQLIDLTTGQKLTTMPADSNLWPLLGTGS